jgi:small-conductance mechanosensitive channel
MENRDPRITAIHKEIRKLSKKLEKMQQEYQQGTEEDREHGNIARKSS